MAKLEFHEVGMDGYADKYLATVEDSVIPKAGEFITIRKKSYRVGTPTWATYDDDEPHNAKLCACVNVHPVKHELRGEVICAYETE